jgi:predicted RNA-binding protein YlxR (DUF448 family)
LVRIHLDDATPVPGRGPGRGAWVCAGRPDCFERAVKTGALERALRRVVDPVQAMAIADRLFGEG